MPRSWRTGRLLHVAPLLMLVTISTLTVTAQIGSTRPPRPVEVLERMKNDRIHVISAYCDSRRADL